MKKGLILIIAVLFLSSISLYAQETGTEKKVGDTVQTQSAQSYILYYFYNRVRCPTCVKFETVIKEIISSDLKKDVANGEITDKFINLDDGTNGHYIKDYKLITKSIIISEIKDGKEIRWKSLDKIWTLAANTSALKSYIMKEIKNFRETKKS